MIIKKMSPVVRWPAKNANFYRFSSFPLRIRRTEEAGSIVNTLKRWFKITIVSKYIYIRAWKANTLHATAIPYYMNIARSISIVLSQRAVIFVYHRTTLSARISISLIYYHCYWIKAIKIIILFRFRSVCSVWFVGSRSFILFMALSNEVVYVMHFGFFPS